MLMQTHLIYCNLQYLNIVPFYLTPDSHLSSLTTLLSIVFYLVLAPAQLTCLQFFLSSAYLKNYNLSLFAYCQTAIY
jgi:hypothetical protein